MVSSLRLGSRIKREAKVIICRPVDQTSWLIFECVVKQENVSFQTWKLSCTYGSIYNRIPSSLALAQTANYGQYGPRSRNISKIRTLLQLLQCIDASSLNCMGY